jgi:hypothetical protein
VKKFRVLTLAVLLAVAFPVFGQFSEYAVKAAYLFNFAKFVEWPAGTFDSDTSPIIIGVLGDDPFGGDLDRTIEGKSVNGHPIQLKRFGAFDENRIFQVQKCNILFIGYSEKDKIKGILEVMRGTNALTVSEIEQFPFLGGMILFDQEGQRITLAINLEAAQKEKLKISSKLLQVAKIYRSE